MAGRRLRDAVKTQLESSGDKEPGGEIHVVIAGLANGYSQYVTTFKEYQVQRYEVKKLYHTGSFLFLLILYLLQF